MSEGRSGPAEKNVFQGLRSLCQVFHTVNIYLYAPGMSRRVSGPSQTTE